MDGSALLGCRSSSQTGDDLLDRLGNMVDHRPAVIPAGAHGHEAPLVGRLNLDDMVRVQPQGPVARMQRYGVRQFVYTNVDRDGMLEGPDLEEVRTVGQVIRGRFIYSGGISSLDDLVALRDLRLVNLAGVISGKALYEHRFEVADGVEALAD